jgi:hypothetical protein
MLKFAYRLALALGIPSVDYLLDNLSSTELEGWLDYWNEEPFGYEIENYRSGLIAALLYNVNKDRKAKSKSPFDFYKNLTQRPSPDSTTKLEQAKAYFNLIKNRG